MKCCRDDWDLWWSEYHVLFVHMQIVVSVTIIGAGFGGHQFLNVLLGPLEATNRLPDA